ncbi:hypothetical protein H0H87_005816, partial [Tephrocybe sp. NHM501043]
VSAPTGTPGCITVLRMRVSWTSSSAAESSAKRFLRRTARWLCCAGGNLCAVSETARRGRATC